jgi:hypothetical protein
MALPTTTFTVNGREYTTTLLPASESLLLLPRIIALLGAEITGLLLAGHVEPLLGDPEQLGATLYTISSNAVAQGPDSLRRLMFDVVRHTTCKHVQLAESIGEAPLVNVFDEHFAGELSDMFQVFIQAARASFTKPSRT